MFFRNIVIEKFSKDLQIFWRGAPHIKVLQKVEKWADCSLKHAETCSTWKTDSRNELLHDSKNIFDDFKKTYAKNHDFSLILWRNVKIFEKIEIFAQENFFAVNAF